MATQYEIETHSATWRAIAAWAVNEIERAQQELERVGQDQRQADVCRGRIAAVREMLAQASPAPRPDIRGAGGAKY